MQKYNLVQFINLQSFCCFRRKKLIRQMSFCEEESEHDIDDEIDEEIIETVRKVSLTHAEPDTAVPLQINDTCDNGM